MVVGKLSIKELKHPYAQEGTAASSCCESGAVERGPADVEQGKRMYRRMHSRKAFVMLWKNYLHCQLGCIGYMR